jgi:hypothetical protein
MNSDEKIRIDFFLHGKLYAMRYSTHVPVKGDEVRFKSVVYKVMFRIWIYDEKEDRVALSIKYVKADPKSESEE